MGGCMSSPKNVYEGEAPVEPITPKAAEGDNVPQENKEEVEKKEEPLVDVSEPAKEEAKAEAAAPGAEEAKKEEEAEKKDQTDVPLVTL
ncbi:hypothetical protein HN51_059241 [Arachis hypogaea]|uniref:Uncharacterized protein n=1 Tax=Arachis hypogaea TaxID=3818 RepID=A0A444X4P9_ARAHY|nr:uncharacterized protein DS421_20g697470 [Arachis hypogaea]RYQ84629.1 hypothetical protein Ahy_B10g104078 [Arachis hypogaea]